MAFEVNPHVSRLRRFQPFHPDSAELVFEQTDPNQPSFEVVTFGYLGRVIEEPTTRLIVLTGDAGHGKTTLCARVLSDHLGFDKQTALDYVCTRGDGVLSVGKTHAGRPLFLITDLSAVDIALGSTRLRDLLHPHGDGVAIVCANEGRLRSCVAADGSGETSLITRTLEDGIACGAISSPEGSVKVINLNYQSVATDGQGGLVDWAIRVFAEDGRSWRPCGRCDAAQTCPILANHHALTDEVKGPLRRRALRDIFAAAERTGAVVTMRQALAVVAHAATGGLTCADVHRRHRKNGGDRSWQYPFLFHQAVFGDQLTPQNRGQVPALAAIRRVDPGRVAKRLVDDQLDPTTAATEFLPPIPGTGDDVTPRSRRDAQRESEALHRAMVFLRRLDYFESEPPQRLARLGLDGGDAFLAVSEGPGGTAKIGLRDQLLRGLEAVQGFHRNGQAADFVVLDPAFFTHRNRAAVISRRIPSRQVEIVDQMSQWKDSRGGTGPEPELPRAVEWMNRAVFVRIPQPNGGHVAIQLDLMRFELLLRWAAGLRSRNQHEAEIRGMTNALSALAAESTLEEEIQVLVSGERRSLMIDVGERIRSGNL